MAEFLATARPRRARIAGPLKRECFDLSALGTQPRLEIAYAMQCRHDDRAGGQSPEAVAHVVGVVAASPARSLLDRRLADWIAALDARPVRPARSAHAFLAYAYGRVAELGASGRHDAWSGDVWDVRRLVSDARPPYTLRFDTIPQPWLADAAKRYARFRLPTAKATTTSKNDLKAVARFARFLEERFPATPDAATITRRLLEAYLSVLAATDLGANSRLDEIVNLRSFFDHCRRHAWIPTLGSDATFWPEDFPRRTKPQPRFIPEHVMAQLETDSALDRLNDPTMRTMVVVLIETGMRAGDTCRLGIDALITDSTGAPCLRFANSKVAIEQIIPLTQRTATALADQQRLASSRWPKGATLMFPRPHGNPDGNKAFAVSSLERRLRRWADEIGLRDDNGRPTSVTPHQFRHTVGTRLINQGVPAHVVQRLLGHASSEMTAVYAHIHDSTLREAFDAYTRQRVDITSAEWVKHHLARIQASLPNGYCARPRQQECPHPNACLTCPDFHTTPEFLPVHQQQAAETRRLIAVADANGQFRLVANHRKVLDSLEAIIPALAALNQEPEHAS